MSNEIKISFSSPQLPKSGSLVLFIGSDLQFTAAQKKLLGTAALPGLARAIKADGFARAKSSHGSAKVQWRRVP